MLKSLLLKIVFYLKFRRSAASMKILVVEDDKNIREMLDKELKKWGFLVSKVENFNKTLEVFTKENPNLVLMDIKLPVYDGYYFTKKIREISEVPIIFISSKSDHMNQIMAIEIGADDFIIKPFEMGYLVSKVKALLRRTYEYKENETRNNEKFNYDELKLEFAYKNKTIPLTKTENLIINTLLFKKNQYVTRNELIDNCWQGDEFIDDNTLFVNISRLRKKLSTIGLSDVIQTKKNVGYKFNEENI